MKQSINDVINSYGLNNSEDIKEHVLNLLGDWDNDVNDEMINEKHEELIIFSV